MKRQRLHLGIFPNRYGRRVRLIFDHEEGEKDWYRIDLGDLNAVRVSPLDGQDVHSNEYSFIDWDGGNGYNLGFETYGWKLVNIMFEKDKGYLMGFIPVK